MANLKKYDPRVDSLVMETQTIWADDVGEISDEDRQFLSQAVHNDPANASSVEYVRSHTGFTRIISVSLADIHRLYHERTSE